MLPLIVIGSLLSLDKISAPLHCIGTKTLFIGLLLNDTSPVKEIVIDSKFDHRIAMSFLCLGLLMENGIKVKNAETINSSFPSFYDIMKSLGANLKKN